MRLASLIAPAACGILVLSSATDAAAQSEAGERRSGWYVGGGTAVAPASSKAVRTAADLVACSRRSFASSASF